MNVTKISPVNTYSSNRNVVSFKKQQTVSEIEHKIYNDNKGLELMGILNIAAQGAKNNMISRSMELEKLAGTIESAKQITEISEKQGYDYLEAREIADNAGRYTANAMNLMSSLGFSARVFPESKDMSIYEKSINDNVHGMKYTVNINRDEDDKLKNITASNWFGELVMVNYGKNGDEEEMYIRTSEKNRDMIIKIDFEEDSMHAEYISNPTSTTEGEHIKADFSINPFSLTGEPEVFINSFEKTVK